MRAPRRARQLGSSRRSPGKEYLRLRAFLRASSLADQVDLVDLLAVTAARIGELLALDGSRVDTTAVVIKLEGTVIREHGMGLFVQQHTKSSAGMRTIKIPSWAMDIVPGGDGSLWHLPRLFRTGWGPLCGLRRGTKQSRNNRKGDHDMWPWILLGYAVFVALLLGAAVFVALFGKDAEHRASGYRVLKLIWFGVTGPGGVAAVIIKLNEIQLI